MVLCTLRVGVVKDDGQSVALAFAQFDVALYHRLEYQFLEVALYLVVYLAGQTQTVVVHREQESLYLKFRIQLALDDLDGVEQFADALYCEVLALYRDDDTVGSSECVDGDESERGRAVDEDKVVLVADGCKQFLDYLLAVLEVEHLYLCSHEVYVARYDVQTSDVGGVDGIAYIYVVYDALVERRVYLLNVNTQTAGCVGLWVGVYDKYRLLQCGQRGSQVDGGGGFAHTALLVG